MIINIEEIIGMDIRRHQINSTPLEQIEFHENGQKIEIPPENVKRHRFIGLSNCDFILMDIYRESIEDEPK